jgi:hypothetical protein
MFLREAFDLRVVDLAGRRIETVLDRIEELGGEVDLRTVREVSAVIEAHAEDRIAGLHKRDVRARIRLRPRVRLHVRELGPEELLRAIDRELLRDIDIFAAAVVTLRGITLGVLVREHGPLGLEHARARAILGRNQLDVPFLALALVRERRREFGVEPGCRRTESRGIWPCTGAFAPEGLRGRHGSMGRLIDARLFRVQKIPAPTGLP